MKNLSELILDRAHARPNSRFGIVDDPLTLGAAVDAAIQVAGCFGELGVGPDDVVPLIGRTSNSYLVALLGLVLAGATPALVNPDYPSELKSAMLDELSLAQVVWANMVTEPEVGRGLVHIDATEAASGRIAVQGHTVNPSASDLLPGLGRRPLDGALLMHTSGTTGTPKFCEQSHEYFLRLGRFVADSMSICAADTVFAPLPMFHINPLGYGVVGALTAGANVLGAERFSASAFWGSVRSNAITVLFLHAPPVEILKRTTSQSESDGHQVSRAFFVDIEFLKRFGIPLGFSGYGSTEGAGLSHIWPWRTGDRADLPEGSSRYGGRARHDLEWRLLADGEIAVRGRRPGVLFSGYRARSGLHEPFDDDGWFHTGDLGRMDADGNLVFIERRTESIRVKGEYVPIGYVEQRFGALPGIGDVAVWRQQSELVDDEVVLYVVTDTLPLESIRTVSASLPRFMRPVCVARVKSLPRDRGVGKVQRRQLRLADALEIHPL